MGGFLATLLVVFLYFKDERNTSQLLSFLDVSWIPPSNSAQIIQSRTNRRQRVRITSYTEYLNLCQEALFLVSVINSFLLTGLGLQVSFIPPGEERYEKK